MFLLYLMLSFLICVNQGENIDDLTFPDDFSIGTAISSNQAEGAWNVDGRAESFWDRSMHTNNRTNADVSSDFYHRYKEDIPLLKKLGVNHFRFSFSWSRLLPTGYVDSANKKGIQFYHDLLDELEKYNITPIATIYHFDHPQSLLEFGGWLNESMAYVFADYAKFVYEEFGSRIKTFSTINEGHILCKFQFKSTKELLEVSKENGTRYLCTQNMLKAHALAYHIYDKEYRHKYKGEVGIAEFCRGYFNKDPNDVEAEKIAHAFDCGSILHPIFSARGNFSDILIRNVAERDQLQGYNQSRLPPLSDEWVEKIRGSADYLGLNHYSSMLVQTIPRSSISSWKNDSGIIESINPNWPNSSIPEYMIVPEGMGYVLRKIKNDYNNPKVYILENGIGLDGGIDDEKRIEFLYSYMKEMLIAIKRDKCNVKMYTVWSFLDSYEFLCEYNCKFGLVSVDLNDKNLTRRIRKSGEWLRSVIEKRKLIARGHATRLYTNILFLLSTSIIVIMSTAYLLY